MQKITEKEFARALSEIDFILKNTDENLQKKIPQSFWNYIEENKDEEYQVTIDMNIPLENQNIREDTINLMAIVYRNYFCTLDEKKEYDEILNQNEQKYQEKYSYENLFKSNKVEEQVQKEQQTENVQIIEYKEENIFNRILNKIKSILNVFLKK